MRLVLVIAILLAARPSHACHKRHQTPFELVDEAATIVVAKVRYVSTTEVELGVVTSIKGSLDKTIVAKNTNTSCQVGFRAGVTALVFLARDGWTVGAYEGYIPDDKGRQREFAPWRDAIAKYADGTTDRVALLVDLVRGTDDDLAREAALWLADSPALLVKIDGDEKKLLVEAKRAAVIVERLTATRFESITDPSKLADTIASSTDEAERIAALERCERVRATHLADYTRYRDGKLGDAQWAKLADACRAP